MGLFSRKSQPAKVDARAGGMRARATRMLRAVFDAAQTTPDNQRHWANADGFSPNAALIPSVRFHLRNRARYEVANNSWAAGIVLTLANDTIGTGPRLQMQTGDETLDSAIEKAFDEWAAEVDLAGKLRTMRASKATSGEVFGVTINNNALRSPVKLDLKLVEADQIADPWGSTLITDPNFCDGIKYDDAGNPVSYTMLKYHPGDLTHLAALHKYDTVPAASMIHYYRADRPGQRRGIPEITPALPLFAMLRRYNLAVLAAAESIANHATVLQTDSPADGSAVEVDPMDTVELERGMATVLPAGWQLGQVRAEQPTTTHDATVRTYLNEIGRCLNMPLNVVMCNSSGYNYSSGQLDHVIYQKSVRIEQFTLERVVLDVLFAAWLDEALLIEGLLPKGNFKATHSWFWDGREHADPTKMANAQQTQLEMHTTTLAAEYAKQGKDWEVELRQRAKEVKLMESLGLPLTLPISKAGSSGGGFGGGKSSSDSGATDGEEVPSNATD